MVLSGRIMKPSFGSHSFDALDVRTTVLRTPTARSGSAARPSASDARSKLERDYPAMANAIRLLWGYPEMNEYFAKLWLADGRCDPIDPEVMADLMLLARVHLDIVPAHPKTTLNSIYGTAYGDRPAKRDVWGNSPRVR